VEVLKDLVSELAFDWVHGTETFLPAEVGREEVTGSPTLDAVQYQGVSPRIMRRVLALLPESSRTAVFVDYGCGKGRGLLFATSAGFRRVVGVEFDRGLAAVARRNLARAKGRLNGTSVEVVVVDAAAYVPPEGPLVAFLYNPFLGVTLRSVASRLRTHAAAAPLWVAYINPVGLSEFESAGFTCSRRVTHRGRPIAVLLTPGP